MQCGGLTTIYIGDLTPEILKQAVPYIRIIYIILLLIYNVIVYSSSIIIRQVRNQILYYYILQGVLFCIL